MVIRQRMFFFAQLQFLEAIIISEHGHGAQGGPSEAYVV